jgi:hypothetical protein
MGTFKVKLTNLSPLKMTMQDADRKAVGIFFFA